MTSLNREEELDDHNYQIRELYAQYGLAMYLSATFEVALVNVLTLAQTTSSGRGTRELFDTYHEANLSVTMGRTLKRLSLVVHDQPQLLADLRRALDERNRLAHHFFRDHDMDFITSAGREIMLAEVLLAQEMFQTATRQLDPFVSRYLSARGIASEDQATRIEAEFEKRMAQAKAKYSSESVADD